jgi:AraC-like DNA-binding protein
MAAFRFRAGAIHEAAFQHPKLRAVRNHVREHIADVNGPTLVEVAKLAGLSPKYFSDFFEQHVGVVFSVWRSRTKIERAKELFLDAPWSPVGAIGIGVGYPDLTTFARAFKRCEGVTPRQYREIASDLAGWRHSTSLHARQRLADRIPHLAYRDQTIVQELVEVANMMHRLA